jgi:F-box protein 21
MGLTLENLPDEIIQHVFSYLPIKPVVCLLQTSKHLRRIAGEQALWRHYCLRDFQHWDEKHHIREKSAIRLSSKDWQRIYTQRVNTDRRTTALLDHIVAKQLYRIGKFQVIPLQGYDAKDTILRHLRVGDDAEDVLARRYWSKAILGHLHRNMAVNEWIKVSQGGSTLERALVAFDMFIIHDSGGDFDSVATQLDGLAQAFREMHGIELRMSTRAKALEIAKFLRGRNLTGLDSIARYRDLENNLISVALKAKNHPSLPLISVAIFCSLAQRLGLDARPCGFPEHVYAMVYPPEGFTLDGDPVPEDHQAKPMYLDPFGSDKEVAVEELRDTLKELKQPLKFHDAYLRPASTKDMVIRAARNIWQSVTDFKHRVDRPDGHAPFLSSSYSLDFQSAFYGAMFALLVLGYVDDIRRTVRVATSRGAEATQIVFYTIYILESIFPEDTSLVEQHIIPLFQGSMECPPLVESVRMARKVDEEPMPIHLRGDHLHGNVKYKIGQLFQHRRYGYTAVIKGWDATCEAGEDWINTMDVDSLSHGRHQSFYHVMDEDHTPRYVAEQNIEIISPPEPPPKILPWAGRYFKRWDRETGKFISNLKDEYPDD